MKSNRWWCVTVALAALLACGDGSGVASGQQADRSLTLLEELTNAFAPSGFEDAVRTILRREWSPLLRDLRTDGMGNLLGSLPGATGDAGPKVLLMAHMDETGFLVRYIDDQGFVYFNPLGGYYDQSVLTQKMAILTPRGVVVGYTGFKSGHAFQGSERNEMVPLRDMFIDIGARSRQEAMEKYGVRPGLPVAYHSQFTDLNGSGRYLARAWDDRIGLALITEVLQRLRSATHPNTLQVAATVQEEIGLRGAAVVYETFRPDIVINLEIGIASDFPLKASFKEAQGRLGAGPSIFVFDGTMIPNAKYVDWIVGLARDKTIPVQFESVTGYGEDASMIQRAGAGVPAVNLGITTRYGHGQLGVIDIADYRHAVDLVHQMVLGLDAARLAQIRAF